MARSTPATNGAAPTTSASTASSAKATSDDVRDQIATLQADIAALTKTVSEYGKAQSDSAKSMAADKAEELRLRASILKDDAEAQIKSGYAQAETAVKDNPAAAVGIAAGLGFLVGLLSARR